MRETHLALDLLPIRPLLFMRDRLIDLLPSQLNLGSTRGILGMDMNGVLKKTVDGSLMGTIHGDILLDVWAQHDGIFRCF